MRSFKIDLYDVIINVVCCEDWREEANRILEKNDYEEEKKLDGANGFAMRMDIKEGRSEDYFRYGFYT